MRRSLLVLAALVVFLSTALGKSDQECGSLVIELCQQPASGCDWCPLKEKCVSLDTYTTSCPACESLSQATCAQSSGNCQWCASLARCVSTSSTFNMRVCFNCTVYDRVGCAEMPGCAWCQRQTRCVDAGAHAPGDCACENITDATACETDGACGWCRATETCVQGTTSAEFGAACTSCTRFSQATCPAQCQDVCNATFGGTTCAEQLSGPACAAAGAECAWDPLLLGCFNSTAAETECPVAGSSCTSLPGCRRCPVLDTCVVLSANFSEVCSCERLNATDCFGASGCHWCANYTCASATTPCQPAESLSETRCGALEPTYEWCETLQACLASNRTGKYDEYQTALCGCNDVSVPSTCWWWQGCDVCDASAVCMPTGMCPSESSFLSQSASSGGGGGGWLQGVWLYVIIGVAALVFVVLVVVVALVCVACCRSSRKKSAAAELAATSTTPGAAGASGQPALPRFDPSRSREFRPDDPELHLLPDKQQLDFGASTSPLDVDKPSVDRLVLRNSAKGKARWHFAAPADEGGNASDRYELQIEPNSGVLRTDEEIEVVLTVTPLCTTVLDISIPLVVEGIGHTFVHARARTALTIKLDYSELQVAQLIGDGAYGRVYRGTWRSTEVAIKEYRAGVLDTDRAKQDVLREIDLLSRLRSPYVVTFYGVVLTKSRACIVMEYCPMGSLATLLKRQKIALPLKLRYALGCARGMQFLHANHVLHRDLKTDNLLVISTDPMSPIHVKLTDFGASRLVSEEGASTYTKGVGTCNYMAPEILNNQAYSSKADVYSFGLVLWAILSQKQPFEDFHSQYAIIKFVVDGERLVPPPGVPVPINKLMMAAWAQDPEARPSFDECVQVLEQSCNTCVGTLRV